MNPVYPRASRKASLFLTLLCSVSASISSVAQTVSPCGPVAENFNTSGSMAGFTSSTVNSTAPGFVQVQNGPNGSLQRCGLPSGGTVIELSTPTYITQANQTSIGYGFELSGIVSVSRVVALLQYRDNTGNINTVEVANFAPAYDGPGGTATECRSIALSTYTGLTPGEAYRLIFQFTSASQSNQNQCIVFDNFRTNGTASQIALPVTFTGFVARKINNGVHLVWNVAGEVDVNRYEVERSSNGRDFTKLGDVMATGKGAYEFTDNAALTGISYYRVRNVDNDNKFKYTNIIRVNQNKNITLSAFPLPARNQVTVEYGSVTGKGSLTVSSLSGQVVRSISLRPDANQSTIDLSGLTAGVYIVRFNNGRGGIETLRIVKQ